MKKVLGVIKQLRVLCVVALLSGAALIPTGVAHAQPASQWFYVQEASGATYGEFWDSSTNVLMTKPVIPPSCSGGCSEFEAVYEYDDLLEDIHTGNCLQIHDGGYWETSCSHILNSTEYYFRDETNSWGQNGQEIISSYNGDCMTVAVAQLEDNEVGMGFEACNGGDRQIFVYEP
jgi:hypothetical protein